MDSLIMDGIRFLINIYDEIYDKNKLTWQQNNKYKIFEYGKLILIKVF